MRIRTIKPEWLDDELLASASDEARVLSIALILMADDYGRGRASLATIASGAWRYQLERDGGEHASEVLARASRALRELLATGFVRVYEVARQRYYELPNWPKHQRVDKPGLPRVPPPEVEAKCPDSFDAENQGEVVRESLSKVSRDSRESLAPDHDQDQDHDQDHDHERTGAARALTTRGILTREFQRRWEAATRAAWPGAKQDPDWDRIAPWLDRTAPLRGSTVEQLIALVLTHWFDDPWVIGNGYPTRHFAKHFERYIEKPTSGRKLPKRLPTEASSYVEDLGEYGGKEGDRG
jgi:hypothetical protein